jgi:hypothetical protein
MTVADASAKAATIRATETRYARAIKMPKTVAAMERSDEYACLGAGFVKAHDARCSAVQSRSASNRT